MSEELDEAAEKLRLAAIRAVAVARYGERIGVMELGGRVWVVAAQRGPAWRALWQRFKCDSMSADPTTKADAAVQLARALLVPYMGDGTVAKERDLFDEMGDDSPALLDILGGAAEALALGPLAINAAPPASSTAPVAATPTSPPKA